MSEKHPDVEPEPAWEMEEGDFGTPPPLLSPPPVPDAPDGPSGVRGTEGYQILRLLGEGGMAQVFHARRVGAAGFARDVAIKRIRTRLGREDSFRRMFVAEALLAARLRHPGIAQVYDLIEEPDGYALVMEYVEGHTLKELMQVAARGARPLDPAFACHVTLEVAEALHHVHQLREEGRPLGIVHRDVTPHNLMVSTTGEVKLLDFGIAWSRLEGRERTEAGVVKGKTSYMSPEQALGEEDLDGRSDQFSLAIVLVELLTGRRVFDVGTNELKTLHRVILASPHDVDAATARLPEALRRIIRRALSREREERFPSCTAFAQHLREYLASGDRVFGPRHVTAEVARLLSRGDATASLSPAALPGVTADAMAPARGLSFWAPRALLILSLGMAGALAVRFHGGNARDEAPSGGGTVKPSPEVTRQAMPPREPAPAVATPTPSPPPPGLPDRPAPAKTGPEAPARRGPPAHEAAPPPRRSLATPMGTSFADAPPPAQDASGSTTPHPETP